MTAAGAFDASWFAGVWTYRAFLNDPDISKPFDDLRFATACMTLARDGDGLAGTLVGEGWGTWIDWRLDLKGEATSTGFRLRGENDIEGERWIYDYQGAPAPDWEHALEPRDVLVGSVIRSLARAKRASAAGVHATFIAVRR